MTPSSPNSLPSLTPDITPALPGQDRFETQTPFFDEVEILDDSLYIDPNKSTEDDTIHPISKITTSPLTTADLRKDPILSALAKLQLKDNDHHQSNVPSSSANSTSASAQFKTFKAKPAPGGMRDEGVGPRMTKSAALRLGIKWEDKREKNGRDGMGFENVPGHKRASMGISIPSLSTPSLAPRENKSSQLRTGRPSSVMAATKRDPQAIAAVNKARADEKKAKRRASVIMPASLGAPSIAPRANKASALRTGVQPIPKSGTSASTETIISRVRSTLGLTTAANVSKQSSMGSDNPKLARRASIAGVRSLGAPSIAPRLNKAALLRAPKLSTTETSTSTLSQPKSKSGSDNKSQVVQTDTKLKPRISTVRAAPPRNDFAGPKPTRSSMLRAGLGAKINSA